MTSSARAFRDAAERLFWTLVVTALTTLTAGQLVGLDVSALQFAAVQGLAAVLQVLVLYGRRRLAVLPDPGAGLPGLPT